MEISFAVNETFENTPDSFFILDDQWRFTYINQKAADIMGRQPNEFIGKMLWEQFPELIGTAVDSIYRKARETGMVQRTEMNGPETDTWYSILAVPAAEGIHVYGQDITRRKQAEKALGESRERMLALNRELEEADRNKDEFLSALCHELRNPLAAISVGLQLIDTARDVNETGFAIEIMKRQMNQLCRLVDDLMDMTRIRCNKIRLKKERMELNTLATLTGEDARQLFEKKGIRLSIHIGCEPLYLYADPMRLKQIIGNLLHNANKFTDAGGETELMVYRDGKDAVIRVRDNGIGIRHEMLPILFEPFTQADESLDRSNGGLGLGLSIVRNIAQLHGGSAAAFSEGLGKGSSFLIRFPLPEQAETS